MSIRLKIIDNKIRGIIPAGRQQPDYVTIFPDEVAKKIGDLLDEYGNGQYEIEVVERTVNDEIGEHVVNDIKVVKHPQKPTAAQQAAYIETEANRRIAVEYSRSKIDRLVVGAMDAMRRGEVDEDFRVYADRRQQIEAEVAAEVTKQIEGVQIENAKT